MGDPATGRAIIAAVKKVRTHAPQAIYCCDPVMGDEGRGFYVKPEIPGIFKTEVVPLADILTANQFELNALTGINIETIEDVRKAVKILHGLGPKIILVTSLKTKDLIKKLGSSEISMLVSDGKEAYRISTPEICFENAGSIAGSGDLCASIFLSRYLETKDIKRSLELCTASVFGIMEETRKAESRELLLIAAQEKIASGSIPFRAEKLQENFV